MAKLFIDKKETVAAIWERLIRVDNDTVTLVIPRGSKLGEAGHLSALNKKAEEAGKAIIVESIDEHILDLAAKHHIQRIHPLFENGERHQSFSDIRPHYNHGKKNAKQHEEVKEIESIELAEEKEENDVVDHHKSDNHPHRQNYQEEVRKHKYSEEEEIKDNDESIRRLSKRKRNYFFIIGLGGISVVALLFWGATNSFSYADINIVLKKNPWQFSTDLVADKSLNAFKGQGKTIPAMLFTETKNTTQLFKASGKKQMSQKATARVTIYNQYDSSPQTLVATTRLATPDGKIFRLDKLVTVPGAKLVDGKITPNGIEVAVTADQPGSEYNIGPFDKMTIVGFKGTPKYAGFFAVMKEKASGGAVGELPYPTDEDIDNAKKKINDILQSALDINVRRRIPEEFKILEGASSVQISKLTVNKSTDDQGNFSIIGEGRLSVIVFKEKDVEAVLESEMKKENPNLVFKTINLEYSQIVPDFINGKIKMAVNANAVLTNSFSEEEVRKSILGKPIEEARAYLSRQEGLEEAKITIRPPWLWSLPSLSDKVSFSIQ